MTEISPTPLNLTRHRTIEIDGAEIFYREAGPAGAPLWCCCTVSRPPRTCSAI